MAKNGHLIITIVMFFLLTSSFSSLGITIKCTNFSFLPEDMNLEDDAFHSSDNFNYIEWWYFDAFFDKGYSAQASIIIIGLIKVKTAVITINIYKDGEEIIDELRYYPITDILASVSEPIIKLDDKQLLIGYLDKKTNQNIFNLSLKAGDTELNLKFISNTKGWQGKTPVSLWGVMLPESEVTGNIKFKGQEIQVDGHGYHDHNWHFSLETFLNTGWYWGKLNSEKYTVVWSNILDFSEDEPILVINEENKGYISIPQEEIQFIKSNFSNNNGVKIPETLEIKVDNSEIYLYVKLEKIHTHYFTLVDIMKYWRYYMNCTGVIRIDGNEEEINQKNFAEYLRLISSVLKGHPPARFNGLLKCLLAQTGTSYKPIFSNLFSSFKRGLSDFVPHFLHLKP